MYATNQRVLAGLGRHRRTMHGLGSLGQAETAVTVATDLTKTISSLFGGNLAPTENVQIPISTPKGMLYYNYTGRTSTALNQTGGPVMNLWAQQGHLDWLTNIANTGTGPVYTDASGGTVKSGWYGAYDKAFAAQLVAAYTGIPMTPTSAATITIPQNAPVGITQPITVTIPAGSTINPTTLASEVTAVMTHVSQGQSLAQAVQTAVNLGEVPAANAATVQAAAQAAQSGQTSLNLGASTASIASLFSNPLVLVGGLAVLFLLSRKRA